MFSVLVIRIEYDTSDIYHTNEISSRYKINSLYHRQTVATLLYSVLVLTITHRISDRQLQYDHSRVLTVIHYISDRQLLH